MATEVPMPKLGLTMEEATILDWLVDDGEVVVQDQPILLIETDKTETEVGSPGSGRIHRVGQQNEVFACGALIGWLLAEGEEPPAAPEPAAPARPAAPSPAPAPLAAPTMATAGTHPVPGGRVIASPNARRVAAERGVPLTMLRGTGPGGRIVSEDVEAYQGAASAGSFRLAPPGQARAVATVAARNLADLLGIDLSSVPVDPVEQRITRDMVAIHIRRLLQESSPATATPPPRGKAPVDEPVASTPLLQEPVETIRLAGMRGTIAKRMHASLQEMAQLTLTMDADMGAVLDDRARRKQDDGGAPSITDYVVAAAARALTRHPRMNAQVSDAGIAVLAEVHVGLAVAVENGLMVPVVTDAAARDLTDLAAETTRLAAAARDGSISPGELEGGTFSVSALGAFGVDAFTPVVNPPNVGILGVGRLRDDVVLVDGEVTTVSRLTLSLTWDHRVIDGVPAAEFCRTIVQLLAEPSELD